MTDPASTPPPPPSGQAPANTNSPPPPPPSDAAALQQRLDIALKNEAEARKEAAKYRTRNDEQTAATLKEQGDFKALYEKAQPDLDKAKKYDAYVEREQKRVDDEAAKLAPHEQLALKKVGTLEDKIELLDAFKAARSSAPPPPPPPGTPPPSGGGPPGAPKPEITLTSLSALSPRQFAELEKAHPDDVAKAISSGRTEPPRPSTWRPPPKK